MALGNVRGQSALDRLRERYESTETKCTACGYVDENGNWTSETDGRKIVYHHVCPSCGASREFTYRLNLDR
ncbi:HVO_0649 family zinc finger protein [Halorarius litoreus]|uniref:HVO_0649 family zinc finger protein n=1 Tax=Halorarius litoreus TaxID=2962676 RepID=UPI0020CC4C4F|nr:HVO_0649 family zinc finger protein [Halorarius litoreus]